MNKKIAYILFISVFFFVMVACNKDNESDIYAPKLHFYKWSTGVMPLKISSSAYEFTLTGKDEDGDPCDFFGFANVEWTEKDTTLFDYLDGHRDTISVSEWFTVISERERVRVKVKENTTQKDRYFRVWNVSIGHTVRPKVKGWPQIDCLTIYQSSQ